MGFINRIIVIALLVSVSVLDNVSGQKFNATISGGFNVSQLEGDNLSGFNKIGINTGIRLEYASKDQNGIATELLFHQKGSSSTLQRGTPSNVETISLNYIAMPVYYFFNEWKNTTEDYYRIQINMGVMTSRLFSVRSTNSFFNNATEDFNNWDVGFSGGLLFRLSPSWGVGAFYERSFLKIYQLPNSDLRGLQSYLINFRILYHI